jgi:hypothetical protein
MTVFITRLEVENQDASEGSVIIRRAHVGVRSWILVHNQQEGAPGEIIGSRIVLFGDNYNINTAIDLDKATPVLYVSLHADWGQKEVYEPEIDVQTTDYQRFQVEFAPPTAQDQEPPPTPLMLTPTVLTEQTLEPAQPEPWQRNWLLPIGAIGLTTLTGLLIPVIRKIRSS